MFGLWPCMARFPRVIGHEQSLVVWADRGGGCKLAFVCKTCMCPAGFSSHGGRGAVSPDNTLVCHTGWLRVAVPLGI